MKAVVKYRYYIGRPFSARTQKKGVLLVSLDEYRDDDNNMWNVVSDRLQEQGIKPIQLTVEQINREE